MSDVTLDALRAAAGRREAVRPADAGDGIAGVAPRYVARPGSTTEAAALLRAAARHGLAVTATGAGTKRDWAVPPRRLDLVVDTGELTGVVEHAAGDLVVAVRAGTRLADLQAVLAPARQQLAIDEPLPGATIGGTAAASTSGPRRMGYGTIRDLLIGITVVRPDGVVAHAGGKVVKNVAGYDLGKLFTGSYGTLGLITECVFRLHPVAAASAYVRHVVDDPTLGGRLAAAVRGAQVVPSALEVDLPSDGDIELAVLIEGTPGGVRERILAIRRMLGAAATVSGTPPPWWSAYPWRPGDVGLKLTTSLTGVTPLLRAARKAGRRHAVALHIRGSAGTGVLYAGLPGGTAPDRVTRIVDELRGAAAVAGGHAVVLTAPPAVRDRVDLWGPVPGLDLMRRVKHRFDPEGRFAPGRFVGGL